MISIVTSLPQIQVMVVSTGHLLLQSLQRNVVGSALTSGFLPTDSSKHHVYGLACVSMFAPPATVTDISLVSLLSVAVILVNAVSF